ncbi:exocyst subunit EXO70 family protein [Striga asiatica]|uniref:Exocyst subunit EXO70 family protein n=1 Tax=Striga asiatica TaxID=4170 RepID=A0A5A7QEQ6_STRAF|nr:exocyst subunit EXO70 family protein [Striga asiatica]
MRYNMRSFLKSRKGLTEKHEELPKITQEINWKKKRFIYRTYTKHILKITPDLSVGCWSEIAGRLAILREAGQGWWSCSAEDEARRGGSGVRLPGGAEAKILRGPHEDLESYLEAVDQLRSIVRFFTANKGFQTNQTIAKLEEEFRQLLTSYSKPVEPDRLFDCLPNSMRPSTGSPRERDLSGKKDF